MSDEPFRAPREPWVAPGQIEHLVSDLTAIIAADVSLGTLQGRLAVNHQWLPIDGPPETSVSTLININSTGPLRLGFGAWRDLILGMQFKNGRGEFITAGGIPIKNVAGYDLSKFMIGQSETFGKIVNVVTRAYRRPSKALVARFMPEVQIITRMIPTPLRPAWSLLSSKELLLGYLGDEADIEFYRQSLSATDTIQITDLDLTKEAELRQARWRVLGPWGDWPWVFRASVPPSRVFDFIASVGADDWIADPAFGIVLGGTDQRMSSVIRGAAVAMGGSAVFRSLPDGLLLSVTANESEQLILEQLKKAFDPDNKLASLPRMN